MSHHTLEIVQNQTHPVDQHESTLRAHKKHEAGTWPASRETTVSPHRQFGRMTVSITWMTPFEASMSAEMTVALSTLTPLVASTDSLPP